VVFKFAVVMLKLHWLACVGVWLAIGLTGCSSDETPGETPPEITPLNITQFLDDHVNALKAENADDASKNHAPTSQMHVYNQHTRERLVYAGAVQIKTFYTGLFASGDLSKLEIIKTKGHDKTDDTSASAFVVWKCEDCKIPEATETMIFNDDKKIVRHTLVYKWTEGSGTASDPFESGTAPDTPVSTAWANHFGAFGGQNVTQILDDYDDSSIVYVFNHASPDELQEHKGTAEIGDLFTSLFATLPAANDVGAPVQVVEEKDGGSPYVLLVWDSPNNGYARATDTFVFSSADKAIIKVQYVVVNHAPEAHVDTLNGHWSAFRSKNVAESRAGYAASAEIRVFEQTVGRHETYTGEDISTMYTNLFQAIGDDTSDLKMQRRWAYNKASENGASAFMVWSCETCGVREGTETLIFDDNGKILRHTFVFLEHEATGDAQTNTEVGDKLTPVSSAWDNHFTAFGAGDDDKIALDYDASSVLHVYDHKTADETIYKGKVAIQALFKDALFPNLRKPGSEDIEVSGVPVQYVQEAGAFMAPHVLLAWSSTEQGYARATDTFVFDSATPAIIKRQYVVVHYDSEPEQSKAQGLFIT